MQGSHPDFRLEVSYAENQTCSRMHARARHAFGGLHQLQRQYLFRQSGAQRSNGTVRHGGFRAACYA